MRHFIHVLLLFSLTDCSWMHARLTYDFKASDQNGSIFFEPGAEDLAYAVAKYIRSSLDHIETVQYAPFKDVEAIKIYVFNDRDHYSNFSHASIKTRGSAVTNEIFFSEKLRENMQSLPNILLHELSHVHTRQYVGTYRYIFELPSWFLEGLAVHVSKGGGAESVDTLQARKAICNDEHFYPDEEGYVFGAKSANDYDLAPHMFYRQAGMFVEYLLVSNPDGFKNVLSKVREGESFSNVWVVHYHLTVNELWEEYKAKLCL